MKIIHIIVVLCMLFSLAVYAQAEKNVPSNKGTVSKSAIKTKDPDVLVVMIFAKGKPFMINVNFNKVLSDAEVKTKIDNITKSFKGKINVINKTTENKTTSFSAFIADSNYVAGEGAILEAIINAYKENSSIAVILTGDVKTSESPLVVFDNKDLSIVGHASSGSLQYQILINNNKFSNVKLPNSQKEVINKAKLVKIFYIVLAFILLIIIIIGLNGLMKRSIRKQRERDKKEGTDGNN